jgi:hypothetical protein
MFAESITQRYIYSYNIIPVVPYILMMHSSKLLATLLIGVKDGNVIVTCELVLV